MAATISSLPAGAVTRFAPSPTGLLHLGHAHSALFGRALARRAAGGDGRFLLRIEDIDAGRCRPEYAAAIEEDLAWLGLEWAAAGAPAIRPYGRVPRGAGPARRRAACCIRASAPARRSRARSRRPATRRTGRRDRPIPAPAAACPSPSGKRGSRAARRTRSASTWRRRWPRRRPPACPSSSWARAGSPPTPRPSATWCWRARTCRPATISASATTTPSRA